MSALLQNGFDVLDMKNYRMEKLPKREKSKFEKNLMIIGGPLAIISFVLILFVLNIPFLENLDTSNLSTSAKTNFENIGLENFIFSNKAMLAIFVASFNSMDYRGYSELFNLFDFNNCFGINPSIV